jgi:hypothetical protein
MEVLLTCSRLACVEAVEGGIMPGLLNRDAKLLVFEGKGVG